MLQRTPSGSKTSSALPCPPRAPRSPVTPWPKPPRPAPSTCPQNGGESTAVGRIALKPRYRPGLASLETVSHVIILTWFDRSARDVIALTPPTDVASHGVFATRAPDRPNPIGVTVSEIVEIHEDGISVSGIDCLDGTPVLDIKPYFASTDSRPDAVVGWHTLRARPLPPVG